MCVYNIAFCHDCDSHYKRDYVGEMQACPRRRGFTSKLYTPTQTAQVIPSSSVVEQCAHDRGIDRYGRPPCSSLPCIVKSRRSTPTLSSSPISPSSQASTPMATKKTTTMLELDFLVRTEVLDSAISTFMIRNIPNKYTRDMMITELDGLGFEGKYDFFYLPIDFHYGCNFGYAFINIIDDCAGFIREFNGKRLAFTRETSSKVCQVVPAKVQGQMANAQQYRNSAVMNMTEKYHPLFFKDGQRIPFPDEDEEEPLYCI